MRPSLERKIPILTAMLLMAGCGGGSGSIEISTQFSGTWTGGLRQSSCLRCNDGSALCVGLGVTTRSVSIEVNVEGSIETDAEVFTAELDGCHYAGTRSSDSNILLNAQAPCSGSIKLSMIEDSSMTLEIRPGEPPASPPSACVINEEGVLRRAEG